MPLYAADLGVTGLTVEVTEIADDKSTAVAATTTGVTELGTTGVYYRNWTLNASTAMLYWQKQSDATVFAIGPATERDVDAILVDTAEIGAAGAGLTEAGGDGDHLTEAGGDGDHLTILATAASLTTVDTVVDAIKAVTDALTQAAAAKLAISAGTIVEGTVSHNVTAATTTVFYCDDITEATADHFNGRVIIFTSGALQYQATDITDYELVTGEGKFTVTALTEAPADNVTFIIV